MKSSLFVVLALALTAFTARDAGAHHSTVVNFDSNHEISITGTLTEIRWLNPHSRFRVNVTNAEGKVEEWLVEMGAMNTMKRAGFPMERFTIGESVTLIGAAGRRDRALLLREVVFGDGPRLTPDMRPRAPGREVSGE